MGNLRRRPNKILVNSVSDDLLSVMNDGKLFIKEYGVIDPNAIIKCNKTCTQAAVADQIRVKVKPLYPCESCDAFTGGITLNRKASYQNDARKAVELDRYFGASIRADELQADPGTGYLHVTDIEKAICEVVEVANVDPKGLVYARERIRFDHAAGNHTLTITDRHGTQISSYAGAADLDALAALIAADADAQISVIDPVAATHELDGYIIIQGDNGFGFLTEVTNLTKDDDYYWIDLIGKSGDDRLQTLNLGGFGVATVIVAGSKTILHWREVAQIFPIKKGDVGGSPDIPYRDQDYCKYYFKVNHDYAYDHSFANHVNQYIEEVIFYVLKSQAEGANWDDKLVAAGFDCDGLEESSSS